MLGLLLFFMFVALGACSTFALIVYARGKDDASAYRRKYDNPHSGALAWLYDAGFDSVDAAKQRKADNKARNEAKREARG